MRRFDWLCATEIPPGLDLRSVGWKLARGSAVVALADRRCMDRHAWDRLHRLEGQKAHARVLLLGVEDGAARARLLRLGFGDVMGEVAALDEIEVRATRLADRAAMLPASRTVGRLRLDLLARDGFHRDRPLTLHPREFALLWRLADTPGRAVSKPSLLREVWRLGHVPETNSLAVHVFRLRAKLAAAGLPGMVLTDPEGGYLLEEADVRAVPMLSEESRADLIVRAEDAIHDI